MSFEGDATTAWVEANARSIGCIEVSVEGLFSRRTPYLAWLATQAPIVLRASSLSIGRQEALRREELHDLVSVARNAQARSIIYPLGFSHTSDTQLGRLLPVARTPETLAIVVDHLIKCREELGLTGLIEPISSPLRVAGALSEPEFVAEVARRSHSHVLLDVASLLATSRNHGLDPRAWLARIPSDLIGAVRISGCERRDGWWYSGSLVEPDEEAWSLLRDLVSRSVPELRLLGGQDRTESLRQGLARLQTIHQEVAPAAPVVNVKTVVRTLPSKRSPERAGATLEVETCPGTALFVLDDAGVFFSETRRELSLFNTRATFVWCLLEDATPVSEIIDRYGSAFGVAPVEAERQVAAILQQWFALGHVTGCGGRGDEVPFTRALAYVITNARLREWFRHAPAAVTSALCVAAEDVDPFVQLDPDELDAVAADVSRAQTRARLMQQRSLIPDDCSGVADVRVVPRGQVTRTYQLVTTTFEIRLDAAVDGLVQEALGHLEVAPRRPDVTIAVQCDEDGRWTGRIGSKTFSVEGGPSIVPILKLLLRRIAVERVDCLLKVHAGVVGFGERCVLLPAEPGSGKTVLTAALIRSGGVYLSDEIALLDASLTVRPVPLALTIKEGSLPPLRTYYPDIDGLAAHEREDRLRVRYLKPSVNAPTSKGLPARWIVFPRFDPNAATTLQPLDRATGLKKLLDQSLIELDTFDATKAELLVRWMRTVSCYELRLSSTAEAVALIRALSQESEAPLEAASGVSAQARA